MKIRIKLMIFMLALVLVVALFCTSGAIWLDLQHTTDNNQARIENALSSIQRLIKDNVSALNNSIAELSNNEMDSNAATTTLEQGFPASSQQFQSFQTMLFNFGFNSGVDEYAFYYPTDFYSTDESLKYLFSKDLGGLIKIKQPEYKAEDEDQPDGDFMLEVLNRFGRFTRTEISDPGMTFPAKATEAIAPLQIHLKEGVPYIKKEWSYDNPFQPDYRSHIGRFIMNKSLNLNLELIGKELGVQFSIYDLNQVAGLNQIQFEEGSAPSYLAGLGVTQISDIDGNTYDVMFQEVQIDGEIIGYVAASISRLETINNVWETIELLATISLAVSAMVAIVAFFFVLGITKPIVVTAHLIEDIAHGEGDLTQRLRIASNDEMGTLAVQFNAFIEQIQTIVSDIKQESESLSSSARELSASADNMTENSNVFSKAILEESNALNQSSLTLTRLVDSLAKTFVKIRDIQALAIQATEAAKVGSITLEKTIDTMRHIEESQRKIEQVTGVIIDIAKQTNLLSLNAAIEASKAGDSGKGFAVVADEIRVLADRSGGAVNQIRSSIGESKHNVAQGAVVIQETGDVFNKIIAHINGISSSLDLLTHEVSDQEDGIKKVSTGVKTVSHLSSENTHTVNDLSTSLSIVAKTTEDLYHITENLSSKVDRFKVN